MGPKYLIRNVSIVLVIGLLLIALSVYLFIWPSISAFNRRASMTWAVSELNSIETALIAVLAASGQRDFHSFFDLDEFARVRDAEMARTGADAFAASVRIYSTVFPILLEHGKNTGEYLSQSPDLQHLKELIPEDNLKPLSVSYMAPPILHDPWGSPYQYYAGPWRSHLGLIPLRIYDDPTSNARSDALTVTNAAGTKLPSKVGFPAPHTKPVYVWSLGGNRLSDQAVFDPSGKYAGRASEHYRTNADPVYLGGGDDINNWDRNKTYMNFYR